MRLPVFTVILILQIHLTHLIRGIISRLASYFATTQRVLSFRPAGGILRIGEASQYLRFLGNRSLHCSTFCIHTVVPLVEMTDKSIGFIKYAE